MHCVIDTSVVLTLFKKETGWQTAEQLIPQSMTSEVNVIELATFLARKGMSDDTTKSVVERFPFTITPLNDAVIFLAAGLIRYTKPFGLSLGDRACLALASIKNLPVYTTDKIWLEVADKMDIDVQLIR